MTPQPDLPAEVAEALQWLPFDEDESVVHKYIASLERQLAEARRLVGMVGCDDPLVDGVRALLAARDQHCLQALNNGVAYDAEREARESAERQLAEAREELRDWNNLVTAVVAPRGLPGLTVEYPKLWPFDGGQNAAMVAYALHVAIERKTTAERQLAEVTARAEGDAKRLDWLDGQALLYPPAFGKSWGLYVADTAIPLREAIDAASAAREG